MKNRLSIVAMAILSITSSLAYAGPELCSGLDNSLHCIYYSGLSEDEHDGRYVKQTYQGLSDIACESAGGEYLTQDAAKKIGTGSHKLTFSICTDSTGKDCTKVADDVFTISQHGNSYTATPAVFNVNFTAYISNPKYKSCNAAFTKPSMLKNLR
jgi:hypothetical protein